MRSAILRSPTALAVLFGVSGAMSYCLLLLDWPFLVYLDGIVLGLVAAYVFVPSGNLRAVTVVLTDLVWIGSYRGAVLLIADHHWNPYAGMVIAGVWGGIGVAAVHGIGQRRLLSGVSLLAAGFAGGVAALPFGWWEPRDSNVALLGCLILWQLAVGVTLSVCSSPRPALLDTPRNP